MTPCTDSQTRRGHAEWLKGVILGRALTDDDRATICAHEANRLIESLYRPDKKLGWVCATRKFDSDFINWGDLGAYVEVHGDKFLVTIEEAGPRDAPLLCEWIRQWLTDWGWDCIVEAEW